MRPEIDEDAFVVGNGEIEEDACELAGRQLLGRDVAASPWIIDERAAYPPEGP